MTARDFHEIAEREHELQNPTSVAKIRLLGERLRLGPESRVLDLACGRGGPALILAEVFGCRITGVELRPAFLDVARERVHEAGLSSRIELVLADAREFHIDPGAYDVAICLGASFVCSDLDGTLAAIAPAVPPGGHVVVGEPYWRSWPLPPQFPDPEESFVTLAETAARFERAGLPLKAMIASSEDDWDTYESLHWRALEEWLEQNEEDPEADGLRDRYRFYRVRYLRWQRELLGWAIFVGRKAAARG